jgi:hypothetical protein
MYAGYLARLLAPLGVYDLREGSVSGAMLHALGSELDEVYEQLQSGLADAFPQTAGAEALARWEQALPLHGTDPDPEHRRAALAFLLGQAEVSCSLTAICAALEACGVQASLEMSGQNAVTVTVPPGVADDAALTLLIRGLIPAHLGIEWAEGE